MLAQVLLGEPDRTDTTITTDTTTITNTTVIITLPHSLGWALRL